MNTETAVARVLVLESRSFWVEYIKLLMENLPLDVVFVTTAQEAMQIISIQDIAILVVSDCVTPQENHVSGEILSFAKNIQERFPELAIVANSSNCNYTKDLKTAGCGHCSIRSHLGKKICEILNRPV